MDWDTEIRRLKLELLRQELDDKILSYREYLERKKAQNKTLATTTVSPEEITEKPFNSILYVQIFGDFEVWHFVILIFIIWILICK